MHRALSVEPQKAQRRDSFEGLSVEDLDKVQLSSVVQSLRWKVHDVQQLQSKAEHENVHCFSLHECLFSLLDRKSQRKEGGSVG